MMFPSGSTTVPGAPAASDASSSSVMSSKGFTNKRVSIMLDETNFLLWKQQILLAVRSHRLEKLLTGVLKPLPATVRSKSGATVENEDYEIFIAQDSALASWILSTISPQLLSQFVGAESASEIWSTVLEFFSSRSTTTAMNLHYKLRSIQKGDLSMQAYVSQIKEVCNMLASCGSLVSDLEKIASILKGLPMEYQPFVAVITASQMPFTLDAAISILFDAETQFNTFNQFADLPSSAHLAQVHDVNGNRSNSRGDSAITRPYRQNFGSRGRGRSGRTRPQCQLCGKLGHMVDRCWYRFDESFPGVTARNNDSKKDEPNAVNVCALESNNSSGCSCHCAGAGTQPGPGSKQVQANVATTSNAWFVDTGATHHVTPDAANLLDDVDYSGPAC